jgi:hypothetical protein
MLLTAAPAACTRVSSTTPCPRRSENRMGSRRDARVLQKRERRICCSESGLDMRRSCSYEKARKRGDVDDGNRVMVVFLYLCTDMRPDHVFLLD